jgi:hypothetical protein
VIELVFILTAFSPPEVEMPRGEQRQRLPQLELLLSRSDRHELAGDWRGWLAARTAPAELAAFSIAAVAGAAFRGTGVPEPESTGYWVATPVHFFAGLDSIHVHPAGTVALSVEEQQALVRDFARVFADSPWRLEHMGRGELLLCGPHLEADGADPMLFLGSDPSAGLPRGADAGTLRRLGSEIEMWLHEHPVNGVRASRHELPVSALWLWGSLPPTVPVGVGKLRSPQLIGADIYAQSLWRLQGRQALVLSATSGDINAVLAAARSDTVVLWDRGLPELEQQWLAGAMRALSSRRVSRLTLVAGARVFSLSGWQRARWWRRSRAWWEVLA